MVQHYLVKLTCTMMGEGSKMPHSVLHPYSLDSQNASMYSIVLVKVVTRVPNAHVPQNLTNSQMIYCAHPSKTNLSLVCSGCNSTSIAPTVSYLFVSSSPALPSVAQISGEIYKNCISDLERYDHICIPTLHQKITQD